MVIIICITAICITALLCFKGITFHKKMEVIPTKIIQTFQPRSPEMDEIEKKLNEANKINKEQANDPDFKKPDPQAIAPNTTAMDQALKNLHEIFGPELPPATSSEGGK